MERVMRASRPSLIDVAEAQLRATGSAARPSLVAATVALAGITLIVLVEYLGRGHLSGFGSTSNFTPTDTGVIVLLGVIFPLAVWRDAGPSKRDYHLAMPVAQSLHSLLRVAAGWVWLMAAMAAFVTWGLLSSYTLAGHAVEGARAAASPFGREVFPAWTWLVPFANATLAYLIGSIVVLRSDRPWLWLGGTIVAFTLVLVLLNSAGLQPLSSAIRELWDGRLGLRSALEVPHRRLEVLGDRPYHMRTIPPDPIGWLGATLLWGATAISATVLALRPSRR